MEVECCDESALDELAFCLPGLRVDCCDAPDSTVILNTLYTATLLSGIASHPVVMLISYRKELHVDLFHVMDTVETVADTLVTAGGAPENS